MLFRISLIILLCQYCRPFEIKLQDNKNNKNVGYLKIRFIDLNNSFSNQNPNLNIRTSDSIPFAENHNLKDNFNFMEDGTINNSNPKIYELKEGKYFAFLNIDNSQIIPFYISKLSNLTVTFGYKYEFDSFFTDDRKISKYSDNICIKHKNYVHCPPIQIKRNKVTEIVLISNKDISMDYTASILVWTATVINAYGIINNDPTLIILTPGIFAGIVIQRQEIDINLNELK